MTTLDASIESERQEILEILKNYPKEKENMGVDVFIGEQYYLLDTFYFKIVNEGLLLVNIHLNLSNTEAPWEENVEISSLEDDGYRITIKVKTNCVDCNQEIIITKQDEVAQ